MLLVLVLLLLAQTITSQLANAGAVEKPESARGALEDNVVQREKRVEPTQQCLDSGVDNLARTDPACASEIARFLFVARNKPENYTLPQDVVYGICNLKCYLKLSQIYLNCTDTWFNVSADIG